MKKLLILAAAFAFSAGLYAADEAKKEVTLRGTGMCGKCELGKTDKCTNALEVTNKKTGKTRVVLFANNLEHGAHFCKGKTEGLVVKGTMSKVDGKNRLTATSIVKKG